MELKSGISFKKFVSQPAGQNQPPGNGIGINQTHGEGP